MPHFPAGSPRGLAQPYVSSMARQGVTLDEMQRRLQGAGIGYRRTLLAADRRMYLGAASSADRLNSVRLDRRLSEEAHQEYAGQQRRTYRYTVELTLQDRDGRRTTDTLAITGDERLQRGIVLDEAEAVERLYEVPAGSVIVHSRIIEAWRRAA